ncbi:MAG TPA: alpha-L-fucosidase, partial [Bacteroidota bacterium]|nr:alpha-L-fucosidase [Bacteroidota bacterium]
GFRDVGVVGDYGTPEQEIPPTGLPGMYWETCMTMNDHWGYNSHDNNWKSSAELIRDLADIASKGGNFLLNVGPTSEGVFPPQSIDRLHAIGQWMNKNSEAIYETHASPFATLEWGRCTQKPIEGGTRLYLHVFNWPGNGKLIVPGIFNKPLQSYLLTDQSKSPLAVTRDEDAIVIHIPAAARDTVNSVVVLDISGKADVSAPPKITAKNDIFVDSLNVSLTSDQENVEIRYTVDGSVPTNVSRLANGEVTLHQSSMISARCFRAGTPVSSPSTATFAKVLPAPSLKIAAVQNGVMIKYYLGAWDSMPDFNSLTSVQSTVGPNFSMTHINYVENFGFVDEATILIPYDAVYTFYTTSDDGSNLYIDGSPVVNNDGLHGMLEKKGAVALAAGPHSIRVTFFQKTGGVGLTVDYESRNIKKQHIPDRVLFLKP